MKSSFLLILFLSVYLYAFYILHDMGEICHINLIFLRIYEYEKTHNNGRKKHRWDYGKKITGRKIYDIVCDRRNGLLLLGSAGPGIFTLYDVSVRRSVFYMLRSVK